jgi:hypothetical protein
MGYAHYEFEDGYGPRGYAVEAKCDHAGCEVQIDHGVAYLCYRCQGYFCAEHLTFAEVDQECFAGESSQVCQKCCAEIDAEIAAGGA